jgi:ABC-2 type transport system permease protein
MVEGASPFIAGLLTLSYSLYLGVWVMGIVTMSAIVKAARSALIALLGIWTLTTILVPRIAPDIAVAVKPLPTRVETDIAIQRDMQRIGDSHNPDDPHFAAFKAKVLAQYSVAKVEDLPVNYRGLVSIEGEKLTSGLFDKYATKQFERQREQENIATAFGLLSPAIGMRSLSMALSGTDLEVHRRFLQQSEAYRYVVIQQLNRLQAEAVTFDDDRNRNSNPEAARRVRIDPQYWRDLPDFAYREARLSKTLQTAVPGAAILLFWLVLMGAALRLAIRRLREAF